VARHFKLGSKSLPVDELMQRHGLPESVVRKILGRLAKQGLVIEHEDGYLLAKPPESIRLEEVLQLFQPVQYQHSETEPDQLDQVLAKLEKQQQESLGATTFASLI